MNVNSIVFEQKGSNDGIALVIHAGGGGFKRSERSNKLDSACRKALLESLHAGYKILSKGGSAEEAIHDAIVVLENFPMFNAGCGAALTCESIPELSAAMMSGSTLDAGAVAGVKGVKNPISAAKIVLYNSPHVMLVGDSAVNFVRQHKIDVVENEYFITEHQIDKLMNKLGTHSKSEKGTVGAVARDKEGKLAAGTSTGGSSGQYPGRIGDSPIIGAGTWASNETCAISSQGDGEIFLRCLFAHEVDARIRIANESILSACKASLERVNKFKGEGGCIALTRTGSPVLVFNKGGMYRGCITSDSDPIVAIYDEDRIS